ncbi:hypothetical protein F5Y16DRAFT_422719 [Xylariaceae sp. FL0255]|nr:hypothetical protein F5Y16DRAFT_422719 [Xylariaceae sp. FL0255]
MSGAMGSNNGADGADKAWGSRRYYDFRDPQPSENFDEDTGAEPKKFGPLYPYCTQDCIRGLAMSDFNPAPGLRGSKAMDPKCPNVLKHMPNFEKKLAKGTVPNHPTTLSNIRHDIILQLSIDGHEKIKRSRDGLRRVPIVPEMGMYELDPENEHSRVFQLRHFELGYTLIGKGFGPGLSGGLVNEVTLYQELMPFAGDICALYLATMGTSHRGIRLLCSPGEISDITFLAYAGPTLRSLRDTLSSDPEFLAHVKDSIERQTTRLIARGILFQDYRDDHTTFSRETEKVCFISFTGAKPQKDLPRDGMAGLTKEERSRHWESREAMEFYAQRKWIEQWDPWATDYEKAMTGCLPNLNESRQRPVPTEDELIAAFGNMDTNLGEAMDTSED